MGTLFIVATPIGNLKDITLRALEVLRSVDLILAEDTRVTAKLLTHYQIKKPLKRYDEHVASKAHEEIENELSGGKNIALVTDAGTPGISDPGARLIQYLLKANEAKNYKLNIVPVPGPSALIAALSASGVSADKFTFLGYPPHKKGRGNFFKKLKEVEFRPIVLYESTHRLEKTLKNLGEVFGTETEIIVAKELTKIHEEFFRGSVSKALEYFTDKKKLGEFVIIIS